MSKKKYRQRSQPAPVPQPKPLDELSLEDHADFLARLVDERLDLCRQQQAVIDELVEAEFKLQGGMALMTAIHACELVQQAFVSQMRAARGYGDSESWGPVVTPYEARMSGALMARLQGQVRGLKRDIRKKLMDNRHELEALREQLTAEYELRSDEFDDPSETTEGEAPAGTFSPQPNAVAQAVAQVREYAASGVPTVDGG